MPVTPPHCLARRAGASNSHRQMRVAAALAPLVDLVFPPRCPLCGAALAGQGGLCADCWSGLAIPGEPCCTACQRPFGEGSPDGMVCGPCLANPPKHDGIAAATLYTEGSRKLVLAFKHGRRIALAPLLARLMAAKLPMVGPDWLIVPVPLHRWRLWRRASTSQPCWAENWPGQPGPHWWSMACCAARQHRCCVDLAAQPGCGH